MLGKDIAGSGKRQGRELKLDGILYGQTDNQGSRLIESPPMSEEIYEDISAEENFLHLYFS